MKHFSTMTVEPAGASETSSHDNTLMQADASNSVILHRHPGAVRPRRRLVLHAFTSKVRRVACLPFVALAVVEMSASSAGQGLAMQHDIITPPMVKFDLGDYPFALAWSADGRYLATVGFNKGTLSLLNVGDGSMIAVAEIKLPEALAVNSDGTSIALAYSHNIIIYNTKMKSVVYTFADHSCGYINSATFSANDKALWVGCSIGVTKASLLAYKLQIDTSEVVSKIAPPTLRVAGTLSSREQTLWCEKGKTFSIAVIDVFGEHRPDIFFPTTHFVSIIDLQRQTDVVSPLEIQDRQVSGIRRVPLRAYASFDDSYIAVLFPEAYGDAPHPEDLKEDKAVAIFDINSGASIAAFGGYATPEGNYTNGLAVLPGRNFVIGTTGRVNHEKGGRHGGITVWDSRTGLVRQRIETAPYVHAPVLSHDDRLLAVGDYGNVTVYKVAAK